MLRAFDDDEVVELNRLYHEEHLSYSKLAERYFVDKATIGRYIHNPRTQYPYFTAPEDIAEINRLYDDEGLTMLQIAKLYGVTHPTVSKHIVNPRQSKYKSKEGTNND